VRQSEGDRGKPAYTSQICSGCQRQVWKCLSVRWHQCPHADCGVSLHRDHNATLNILALGKKQESGAGQASQARTWANGPSVA
jgi:putative transposase